MKAFITSPPEVMVAVAAGVILSQLLLLAGRVLPGERTKVDDRGSERPPTAKANSPVRPKNAESRRLPTPQESGVKGKNQAKVSAAAEGTITT